MNAHAVALLHSAAPTIGWVSAAAVLLAYGLLMSGRIRADGVVYLVINVAGSGGLAVSMGVAHAWQSAVVNSLWLVFGLAPLTKVLRRRERDHDAEQARRHARV